jgi:HNH endonuclease
MGYPSAMGRPPVPRLPCTIEGCNRTRQTYKSGLCGTHTMRRWRTGTTHRRTTEEIFWSKVEKTKGCWFWRGYVQPDGYPRFKYKGRPCNAHRLSYMWLVGPIPEGLQLDHLCRVKHCVNPAHLEPVTPGENTHRIPGHPIVLNAAKTHCPQGHPYTPDNLLGWAARHGRRACRECHRLRQRQRRQRGRHQT